MKFLFVGGPLHGTETEVPAAPRTLIETVDRTKPEPPGQYVHVPSGATYVLETIRVPVQSPLSDTPVGFYERDTYLLAPLMGDPKQAHAAHADALMRWWLSTGRRVSAEEAEAIDRRRTGVTPDGAPAVLYTVECQDCETVDAVAEIGFDTLADRAKWSADHLAANPGHTLSFAEVAKGGVEPAVG